MIHVCFMDTPWTELWRDVNTSRPTEWHPAPPHPAPPRPAPAPALGIAAIKLSCYPRTKKQLIYRNNEGIEPVGAAACVEQMHNWNVIWVCDS